MSDRTMTAADALDQAPESSSTELAMQAEARAKLRGEPVEQPARRKDQSGHRLLELALKPLAFFLPPNDESRKLDIIALQMASTPRQHEDRLVIAAGHADEGVDLVSLLVPICSRLASHLQKDVLLIEAPLDAVDERLPAFSSNTPAEMRTERTSTNGVDLLKVDGNQSLEQCDVHGSMSRLSSRYGAFVIVINTYRTGQVERTLIGEADRSLIFATEGRTRLTAIEETHGLLRACGAKMASVFLISEYNPLTRLALWAHRRAGLVPLEDK